MNQSRTDEVMRLADIIAKADSRWSGLQETRNALRSAVQAMEDELAAAGKWHALMQRAGHALGLLAGTDLLAELIPAIERLAAAKQGEIVMWQYRSYFDENTVTPGWSKWNPVEPRNIHTTTVQDMVDEIKAFIAQGARYEIRALFTHPAPVQEGWKPTPTTEIHRLAILKSAKDLLDARQEWDSTRIERLSEKECRRTSEELAAANKAFDAAIDAAMLAAPSTGEPT